ncbi:MAG: copper chaperone PCu(A)C [Rhodospirillales bacterium]|nr:copper chaperone PCu(A)C [Rhodospirillales bacterium]
MKKFTLAAVALIAAVSATPAFAGGIEVSDAWARASAKMAKAGAAFLTIKSTGGADRLIAAKAGVSKKVELHTHIKEGDIMKMRRIEGGIEVPAGGMAMLKPGGHHVMFMGLSAPFNEGTMFPLTLVFEKAGEIQTKVMVKKPGAMGGMKMEHGKMKHN